MVKLQNSVQTTCKHQQTRCLNQYEYFRKYECGECGGVFICECERELALAFLPHQISFGTEYGTRKNYKVTGFSANLCPECRGELIEAYPRAAIYGQKGKIERYYWREIFKTYCEISREWLKNSSIKVKDILEFETQFPEISRELKKRAKNQWQLVHKTSPKYNTKEKTESRFLTEVQVPIREIEAAYRQIQRGDQKIGRWINSTGELTSVEKVATEWYVLQGFSVIPCERRLISTWVATLLSDVIQNIDDPLIRQSIRHSTKNWTTRNRETPIVVFNLPEDFGSHKFFDRRREALNYGLDRIRQASNLTLLFDSLLDNSFLLRDYLWVNDDDIVADARKALTIIPKETIISCIEWTVQDFWQRQPGWPDLFVYRDNEILFSEVKSPHDELSLEQMNWFEWAIKEAHIPCEIFRVTKEK